MSHETNEGIFFDMLDFMSGCHGGSERPHHCPLTVTRHEVEMPDRGSYDDAGNVSAAVER